MDPEDSNAATLSLNSCRSFSGTWLRYGGQSIILVRPPNPEPRQLVSIMNVVLDISLRQIARHHLGHLPSYAPSAAMDQHGYQMQKVVLRVGLELVCGDFRACDRQ